MDKTSVDALCMCVSVCVCVYKIHIHIHGLRVCAPKRFSLEAGRLIFFSFSILIIIIIIIICLLADAEPVIITRRSHRTTGVLLGAAVLRVRESFVYI